MRHQLRLFFIALQFLTRCPVPRWVGYEPAWLQQCARWFPAVGSVVGLFAGAVLWLALQLWSAPIAAGLSMAASIWLTGGFHEDGWADSCDGLGGAVSRERALAIMKDSRIGSYGALGLILMLGLKAACLVSLATAGGFTGGFTGGVAGGLTAMLALTWAHTASRAAPVWLMRRLPYAGDAEQAKARPMAMPADGSTLRWALAWVLGLSGLVVLLAPQLLPGLAVAALAAIVSTALLKRLLARRLGGYTGDTLGACQQLAELAALLSFTAGHHP